MHKDCILQEIALHCSETTTYLVRQAQDKSTYHLLRFLNGEYSLVVLRHLTKMHLVDNVNVCDLISALALIEVTLS